MKDTIYREDAIATIEKRKEKIVSNYESDKWFRKMISEVEAIPSADRPKGKWIRISSLYSLDRTYRCSVCGKVIDDMPMDEYYDPAYKGCPYCLTRMKGADDE